MLDPDSAAGRALPGAPAEGVPPPDEVSDAESLAVAGLVLQASPLLVAAPGAAHLCGVSERTWRKLDRCGRVPSPIAWGRRRLWATEELRRWSAAGCPARERWEARKGREVRP